jgi:exodeoxyribonuclease VII large subunit
VRVLGEVSGFRDRTHWYFDLKDAEAVVSCVMFQSAARRAGFAPENGREVVATGRVEYYAKGGKVSFIAEKIEPVGAGALDLKLKQLVEEARSLGWLDPARKRRLPGFPRRIAVVTSRTAAALQDVLVTMKKRCPAVGVLLVDARVQGAGAAEEVAAAIWLIGKRHEALRVDAVLVTRGGGSMEDLWAFNERVVAEAIVSCPIPVVAAIGHETDTTLAELVADERCATPTQAAMRLTPDTTALVRQLESDARTLAMRVGRRIEEGDRQIEGAQARLDSGVYALLHDGRRKCDGLAARLERNRPQAVVERMIARLDAGESRLRRAIGERLAESDPEWLGEKLARATRAVAATAAQRVASMERHLKSVSPLAVLDRGYSVTTREDGRIVRSERDVRDGEVITTRVAEGTVVSVVGEKGAGTGSPAPQQNVAPAGPVSRGPRSKVPRAGGAERGLFEG